MNKLFQQDDAKLAAWSEAHLERLKRNAPSSSSSGGAPRNGNPNISWPLERPMNPSDKEEEEEEDEDPAFSPRAQAALHNRTTIPLNDLLPSGTRSQSSIALRAWCLGQILSVSLLLALHSALTSSRLWRPPFFLSCLSLFHFLEFWTHARYNLPNATVSAFLLFDNGWPYMLAHTTALLETTLTSIYLPVWQDKFRSVWVQQVGFALIVLGQLVRSMAIARAGTNFNHQVQREKKETHELVTDGIYGILRHPSYFGFFWWAVGTQVAVGNPVCFCIYVVVLWRFFSRRIYSEERHLINFFGKDYLFYRTYTKIGIPFIRTRDYPELVKPAAANGRGAEKDR